MSQIGCKEKGTLQEEGDNWTIEMNALGYLVLEE